MTNAIDHLMNALTVLRMDNKSTIKGMVAKLTEQGFNSELWDIKSRASFIDSIDAHMCKLSEELLVTELDALKADISRVIADAGKASFELGNLLLKAREEFNNQNEFLDWVDANFGIKKAWCFKLMKVSQVFTAEPWAAVATSVLYVLQSQATDEQLLEARKFAEAGKLDMPTVKALLAPVLPVVKPAVDSQKVESKAAESVQTALMSVEPVEVSETVEPAPAAAVAPVAAVLSPVVDKEKNEMQLQIAQLTETVRQLNAALAEANKPRLRSGSDMPMLPQFHSKYMHVRLGLDAEEAKDKDAVLEAFKALCKAGYGRAHEAWNLLDEARHTLCHAAEAQEATV